MPSSKIAQVVSKITIINLLTKFAKTIISRLSIYNNMSRLQAGSKVKYSNIAKAKSIVKILENILHVNGGSIDMKHIKQDLSFKS